jgi:hypothetical protein
MTPKQEEALRDYLREAVVPLIEDVLTKKLGQAMTFAKEELAQPAPVPIKPIVDPDLDVNQRLAFKLGWKSAEEAHGITKGQP